LPARDTLFLRLAVSLAILALIVSAAHAETVHFRSATIGPSALQERLAKERGEPVPKVEGDMLVGELYRPAGNGPFPAIVSLHGCAGRSAKDVEDAGAARFVELGYVVLIVDSFTTRGIRISCSGQTPALDRVMDAYGGLAFLAGLPFVDPERIAVVGYSQGAMTALSAVALEGVRTLFDRQFKAAVAYYPLCAGRDGNVAVPTVILIGEKDDWTPASECTRMMAMRTGAGADVKLVVYPDAYHGFNGRSLRERPRTLLGHHLEYNEAADDAAWHEMTSLLARTIGP
jgi:dienelactone hydrolase